MIIVWGTKLCGKVDQVPGLCWVSTQFAHLYYIPLVPTGSYAVFAEDGDGWQGKQISLSWKSVFAAWIRTVLVLVAIAGVVVGLIGMFDHRGPYPGMIGTGIALLVFGVGGYIATTRNAALNLADHDRAVELADLLGVNEEGRALIDLAYGEISEDEARRTIERAGAAREAEEAEELAAREQRRAARAAEEAAFDQGKTARQAELRAKAPATRKRVRL